jgi:hypothetical protein
VVSNIEKNSAGLLNNDSLGSLQMVYVSSFNSIYFRTFVKYHIGEQLKVSAHAKVANYTADQNIEAWHLPGLTYSFDAHYTLGKRLELTAGFDGMSQELPVIFPASWMYMHVWIIAFQAKGAFGFREVIC